ncbi:MAG: hypothetical protein ACRCWM_08360 [Sarcina sp.]
MKLEEKVIDMTDEQIKEDLKERDKTLLKEEIDIDEDIESKKELTDVREAEEEEEKLKEDEKGEKHQHHFL